MLLELVQLWYLNWTLNVKLNAVCSHQRWAARKYSTLFEIKPAFNHLLWQSSVILWGLNVILFCKPYLEHLQRNKTISRDWSITERPRFPPTLEAFRLVIIHVKITTAGEKDPTLTYNGLCQGGVLSPERGDEYTEKTGVVLNTREIFV